MSRTQSRVVMPKEYIDNQEKRLCRVCGIPKDQFEKRRRYHCSEKCSRLYQECFESWSILRNNIVAEQKQCVRCGSKERLEVDRIVAIVNGGDEWDRNNLQVLCHKCHLKKTRLDMYKRKYVQKDQTQLVS